MATTVSFWPLTSTIYSTGDSSALKTMAVCWFLCASRWMSLGLGALNNRRSAEHSTPSSAPILPFIGQRYSFDLRFSGGAPRNYPGSPSTALQLRSNLEPLTASAGTGIAAVSPLPRVPKVPISFGSGAGEDWIALDRTGNARGGKLLACFALATKPLKYKGLLREKESYWRREGDSNPRYSF